MKVFSKPIELEPSKVSAALTGLKEENGGWCCIIMILVKYGTLKLYRRFLNWPVFLGNLHVGKQYTFLAFFHISARYFRCKSNSTLHFFIWTLLLTTKVILATYSQTTFSAIVFLACRYRYTATPVCLYTSRIHKSIS